MTQKQRLEIIAFGFTCLFLFLMATAATFQVMDRHEKYYCARIQATK